MTLRLYWTNAAPDATPPAFRNPNWDKTTGAVVRKLSPTKAGANTSVVMSETSTSSTYDMPHGAWVSDPFLRDATIGADETIAATMGRTANANSSFYSMLYAYVMAPDGSVRATVVNKIGSSYWTTTAGNGGWNPGAIGADVDVKAGDRLVVEPGVRAANTTSTNRTATMWYGGTGTDFSITAGDTNVTTKVGWIELTGDGFESLWTPAPTGGAFLPFFAGI